MDKSSQIFTTNQQTPTNTPTSKAPHPKKNCIKPIPYTVARRMHAIITDKNLQKKTRFKELHTKQNQRVYPTTLINKGFELAEKMPQRELRNPKKAQQQETPGIRRNLQ